MLTKDNLQDIIRASWEKERGQSLPFSDGDVIKPRYRIDNDEVSPARFENSRIVNEKEVSPMASKEVSTDDDGQQISRWKGQVFLLGYDHRPGCIMM